jgi:hypothetical protein
VIARTHAVTAAVARAALPLAALGALTIWSCRPTPPAGGATPLAAGRVVVISDSEIAHMSVRTAWDVVRMRAPRLSYGRDSAGRPAGVMIQPRRSVNADETPLLVVDGLRMSDLGFLSSIPASDVRAIRILDTEAAEPLYGLRAAGGAIVVETKRSP